MTRWIAYATAGQEFSAQEQCEVLGYTCQVPRKVDVIRQSRRRFPDVVTQAFLPNYLFITGGAEVFHAIKAIKEIRGTAMGIGPQNERLVQTFIDRVEKDFAARMGQIEAGQRVAEYAPGDLLTLMTGPFSGQVATFRRMIEDAHDVFPRIEAELGVSLMGKPVLAVLDPINTRRAV